MIDQIDITRKYSICERNVGERNSYSHFVHKILKKKGERDVQKFNDL